MQMGMRRGLLILSISTLQAGCERGSAAPPTEPGPSPNAPAFTVLPSTTVLSAPRGWNAIVNLSVARRPNYTEAVTLAAEGLPPSIRASFPAPTLPGTSSATRLDLEVDSLAAPGTFPFTLRVAGPNATASVTSMSFTVPRPSFSLTAPASVTAVNDPNLGSTMVSFLITRENSFRGVISFTVSGVPAGVVIFSPYNIAVDWNTGSFFLRREATAVPGNYPLTLRATGPEAEDRTAIIMMTIPPPA